VESLNISLNVGDILVITRKYGPKVFYVITSANSDGASCWPYGGTIDIKQVEAKRKELLDVH